MTLFYTLDNELIEKFNITPTRFTGIIELKSGTRGWKLNGKLHRIDGPTIIYPSGKKEWYINGKQITEEQHKLYVDLLKLKGLL